MDANSQTLQVPPWLSFTMASKVCTQANRLLDDVILRSFCFFMPMMFIRTKWRFNIDLPHSFCGKIKMATKLLICYKVVMQVECVFFDSSSLFSSI